VREIPFYVIATVGFSRVNLFFLFLTDPVSVPPSGHELPILGPFIECSVRVRFACTGFSPLTLYALPFAPPLYLRSSLFSVPLLVRSESELRRGGFVPPSLSYYLPIFLSPLSHHIFLAHFATVNSCLCAESSLCLYRRVEVPV